MLLVGGNGSGIPCGPFYVQDSLHAQWEAEYPNWTGGQAPAVASTLLARLAVMRTHNQNMIIGLAGWSGGFLTDGKFDLVKWKAKIDAAYALGIESYIADGTIYGNYIIDEPKATNSWGGECVPNNTLDDMAEYSKTKWPTLPCIIRAEPTNLTAKATTSCGPWPGGDYQWQYVDAAWCQYTIRKGNINTYIANNYASAQTQGLSLVVGVNWRDGGDGASQDPPYSVQSYPDGDGKIEWWCVSPTEMGTFSEALLADTYWDISAWMMWELVNSTVEPSVMAYWDSAPMQAAFSDLKDLCAARERRPLLKRVS